MSNDETVKTASTIEPINERDLAPVPVADKARAAAEDLDVVKAADPSRKFDVSRKTDKNGKPIRSFVSMGERIHNEITYRGVDWIMNSTFGVAFAYITSRTEIGRKIWSKPLNSFFTKIFEPIVEMTKGKGTKALEESKKALETSVGYGVMFLSIMFGGTVTIPPLMHLENPKNKVPFVKKLDTWIYGKDKVENDPKFAQAYKEIKEQPKKDFATGMKTRFIALAPLLAFTVYEPSHKWVKKNFYDYIMRGTKFAAEKIGLGKTEYWAKKSVEGIEAKAPHEAAKIETNWQNLHDTIAFDFGLTIMYSFLHEIAYKLFAQKKDDARKAKAEHQLHATLEKSPIKADVAPEHDTHAHSHTPHAKVSNVAAREVLKPAEQREMVQV